MVGDDEHCPYCGDELRDGKCARACGASRKDETSKQERIG